MFVFPTLSTGTDAPEAIGPSNIRNLSHPEKPDHSGKGFLWASCPQGRKEGDSCDMQGNQTPDYLDKLSASKFFKCPPFLQILENHKLVVSKT